MSSIEYVYTERVNVQTMNCVGLHAFALLFVSLLQTKGNNLNAINNKNHLWSTKRNSIICLHKKKNDFSGQTIGVIKLKREI